jgi:hypothetical protein
MQDVRVLITKLTRFVTEIFETVSQNRRPALLLAISCDVPEQSFTEKASQSSTPHLITIGRNMTQTISFCRFVKVLQVVFSLLKLGKVSTKRGWYNQLSSCMIFYSKTHGSSS